MHSYIQSLLCDDQNVNTQSAWNSRYNRIGGGRSYYDDVSPWGGRSNRLARSNRFASGGLGGAGLYDDGLVSYGSAGRFGGRSNWIGGAGNVWADDLACQQNFGGNYGYSNLGGGNLGGGLGYSSIGNRFGGRYQGLNLGACDEFGNVGNLGNIGGSRFNRFGSQNVLGGGIGAGAACDQFGNYISPWASKYSRFGRGQVGVGAFGAGLCGDDFDDEYEDEIGLGGGAAAHLINRIGVKHLPVHQQSLGGGLGGSGAGIVSKVINAEKQNIVDELAIDRERDEFQVNLCQQFIKNRRYQSNTPHIVKALASGERIPKRAIVQGLLEDVAVNRVADAVALQCIADNSNNRNSDHIIQDLIIGEVHLPHSNQYEYQHQDAKFDNTLEVLARKLSSPNVGRKLVRKGIVDDVIELAGARSGLQNQYQNPLF